MSSKLRRLAIGVSSILVATTGAVAVGAAPAYADEVSCRFTHPSYSCTTGGIAANSRYHAIYIEAASYTGNPVTCRAYDRSNTVEVGRVRSTRNNVSKVIRGLYGVYFVVCVGEGSRRSGQGWIKTDNYLVD